MKSIFCEDRFIAEDIITDEDEPISRREHDAALRRVLKAFALIVGGMTFALTAFSAAITAAEIADLAAETIATGVFSAGLLWYGLA